MKSSTTLEKRNIVIVIGATGFLGSHFMNEGQRNLKIVGTYRSSNGRINASNHRESFLPLSDLKAFLEKSNKEVAGIINCAVSYTDSSEAMYAANVELPQQLVEWCESLQIPKIYLFDTFYSFSDHQYRHLSEYTLLKQRVKEEIMENVPHSVDIRWFVLGHIFGEHDGGQKFIPNLIRNLLKNEVVDLTEGNQLRDFTYVKDVVNTVLDDLCLSPTSFGFNPFYLGTGTKRSIRSFIEDCKIEADSFSKLNFGKLGYRENEIMNPFIGNDEVKAFKLKELIGFDEGLKRTIEYYQYETGKA